jgi:hypothetical protein
VQCTDATGNNLFHILTGLCNKPKRKGVNQ